MASPIHKALRRGTAFPIPVQIFIYLFCTLAALVCFLPLMNMLALSLSSGLASETGRVQFWPVDITFDSYRVMFRNPLLWRSYGISVVRSAAVVVFSTTVTLFMAYPLSKNAKEYPTRRFYIGLLLFSMLFNGGIVPTYIVTANWLRLKNSFWVLVLPQLAAVFNVILIMNFIRNIPKELEEAAKIDGASYLTILFRVLIPLLKPVLAVVVLYNFVGSWNEWFAALIYFTDFRNYPIQTLLRTILNADSVRSFLEIGTGGDVGNRSLQMAQVFITMLPIMIIYPWLQRYFTTGIVLGSVKS